MIPKIRQATTLDINNLLNIYQKYQKEQEKVADVNKERWQLPRKTIIKFIKTYISNKDKIILVLINDGIIEGFILGRFEKGKNNGTIDDIYITPEMRGKGFSSQLKNDFIKWFNQKRKGKGTISLYTLPKNKVAQEAYKKWGFKISDLKLIKEIK
jgi:GNAT superfamily N-acetyltransferase